MDIRKITYTNIILAFILALIAGCGGGTNGGTEGSNGESKETGRSLSNTSGDSYHPVIAEDTKGNLYVAWEEKPYNNPVELYLVTSSDSGDSFSQGKNLSRESLTTCERTGTPSDANLVAGAGTSPLLVWIDRWIDINTSEIKFFEANNPSCKTISDSFDVQANVYTPQIGLNDGEIHITWVEEVSGQKEIFYRRSEDNGGTFIPSDNALRITDTFMDSSEPLLGFEGSSIVDMVWVEGSEPEREIMFTWSIDRGDYFIGPMTVSDANTDSHCPVIKTAGGGYAYIAYKGNSGNEGGIYFSRRKSSTSLFSSPVKVSSTISKSPSCPEMEVGQNGLIYVVWSDSGGIWMAISGDGGYSFSQPKDISLTESSSSPAVVMDSSYINIVWVEEETGGGDIYLSASRDNGKTFSQPKNISNSSSPSANPVIASDGESYIYVAWEEGEVGKREIFFRREQGARGLPQPKELSLTRFLDISGDGKSDIVIGAPKVNDTGAVYVFYSDFMNFTGSDTSTTDADDTFSGRSAGDQFGYDTAIAGDINGDGYADIIVGSPYADIGLANSGSVYIYFGGPPSSMDSDADITITGASSGDFLDVSVSPAGDVNDDGFDDIIIGLPKRYKGKAPYSGSAYIFFGGPIIGNKDSYPELSIDDADIILVGEDSYESFGYAVSMAGDFNNDGFGDVIVGAPLSNGGGIASGRAYLYFGGISMGSMPELKITGSTSHEQAGYSVGSGGDINGDGYDDIIIGVPYAKTDNIPRGKAYIIYGGEYTESKINLANTGASVTMISSSMNREHLGYSVSTAGDVNDDGYDDIIVGSRYMGIECIEPAQDGYCKKYFPGNAYLFLGGPSMNTTADLIFTGENQEDRFGAPVACAGDVNGDGYSDMLVGAYLADNDESNNGKTYLFLGNSDNIADAIFTGGVEEGWAGYSVYKQ